MELQKTTIDALTGEIIEDTITNVRRVKADDFMQVYLQDMASLAKMANPSHLQVMLWLWKDSIWFDSNDPFPGNKVVVNRQLMDSITKATGLVYGTIRNTVAQLAKDGFIIKDANYRGVYYLNPKYFFKGKIGDRVAKLNVCYSYELTQTQDES